MATTINTPGPLDLRLRLIAQFEGTIPNETRLHLFRLAGSVVHIQLLSSILRHAEPMEVQTTGALHIHNPNNRTAMISCLARDETDLDVLAQSILSPPKTNLDNLPELIDALGGDGFEQSETAIRRSGMGALFYLMAGVTDGRLVVRGRSADIIAALGRFAHSATNVLLDQLRIETDAWVQSRLTLAISKVGGELVANIPGGLDCIWVTLWTCMSNGLYQQALPCLDILMLSRNASKHYSWKLLEMLAVFKCHSSGLPIIQVQSPISLRICMAISVLQWGEAASSGSLHLRSPVPNVCDFVLVLNLYYGLPQFQVRPFGWTGGV